MGGRSRHRALAALALAGLLAGASAARATPDSTTAAARAPDTTRVYLLPGVEVWDTHPGALGPRATASEGWVRPEQVAIRPLLRVGDVLESVPGLLVSQHSGEGKANQYYLRGFNLDHGTDFATSVDGVPVNMPSHTHGQGYTDLNFLLPGLVGGVLYRKGPYSVEDGSARSPVSTTLDAELGRRAAGPWSVVLQVFNVLDAEASDIDYFYVSRLPGEPVEGVLDLHFHPQAPRSFRIVVSTGPRP